MEERIDLVARFQDILEALPPLKPAEPPMELRLPNLRCRNIRAVGTNTQWHIEVVVENVGQARSRRECEVLAILSIVGGQPLMLGECPPLEPMASQPVQIPVSGVNSYDVHSVTVIVDPPSSAQPGGKIWESDKTDNVCQGLLNRLPEDPHPPKDPVDLPEEGGPFPDPPIRKG
jgi:hypothetical protein